ncbi:MAG: ATPase, T2SS/T4P/T4SS family [Chloroflexota bacterium]
MSSQFFKELGSNYFVHPEENPEKALNAAAEKLGKHPLELIRHGWAGPIHQLIHHPAVRDIMVQHGHKVWIRDSGGKKTETPAYLTTEWVDFLAYQWRYANHITASQGKIPAVSELANFRHTLFFPRTGGGIRFQYVGRGFSALGSSVYIRRLRSEPFELETLVKNGTLPQGAADTIIAFMQAKTPIVISGQTGSGKTTLLGALAHKLQTLYDPINLLVVEKSHELPLKRPAYRWEQDAEGLVGLDQLAANATQMGLEWLILGECTGPEAYFVLKAFTQGVPVMTTLHATSATNGLTGLAMLALEYVREPELLPTFLKNLANEAVISIHLENTERPDGVMLGQVTGIEEIIDVAGSKPVVNPIWVRKRDKNTGIPSLVFNRGCVVQASATTKFRFQQAGIEFPPQSVYSHASAQAGSLV